MAVIRIVTRTLFRMLGVLLHRTHQPDRKADGCRLVTDPFEWDLDPSPYGFVAVERTPFMRLLTRSLAFTTASLGEQEGASDGLQEHKARQPHAGFRAVHRGRAPRRCGWEV